MVDGQMVVLCVNAIKQILCRIVSHVSGGFKIIDIPDLFILQAHILLITSRLS